MSQKGEKKIHFVNQGLKQVRLLQRHYQRNLVRSGLSWNQVLHHHAQRQISRRQFQRQPPAQRSGTVSSCGFRPHSSAPPETAKADWDCDRTEWETNRKTRSDSCVPESRSSSAPVAAARPSSGEPASRSALPFSTVDGAVEFGAAAGVACVPEARFPAHFPG